jgi:CheY-like chemotaxis protein
LEWLKEDGTLLDIPVIVLTSSSVKTDEDRAHDSGARAYLIKPLELDDVKELFLETEQFLHRVGFEHGVAV